MANTPQTTPDPEEQRADLMATLAAARELGPDMDKAIADSYLERKRSEQAAQPKQQQVAPVQAASVPGQPTHPLAFLLPSAGICVYIVLLIVSHGALWWMFWLIPALGGWGWWGGRNDAHDQRRAQRNAYRQARWQARYNYRYGPPPTVPAPQEQPQPPQVSAPAPTPAPTQQPPASQAAPLPPTPQQPQASAAPQSGTPTQPPPLNPAG